MQLPFGARYFFGMGAILNIFFAVAMWKWKRWGVYGFGITSLAVFVFDAIYLGLLPIVLFVIVVVIWFFVLRPAWKDMS